MFNRLQLNNLSKLRPWVIYWARPSVLTASSWGVVLLGWAVLASHGWAQTKDKSGGSSRSQRLEAIAEIPFQQISLSAGRRIRSVVTNPSFYRRLPVRTIDADTDHFRFLVRNPEVMVSIWKLMGLTKMSIQRTGPYAFKSDDGVGTISELELVYGNDDVHIFYGSGNYSGSMLKQKLTGRCVIMLRTSSSETEAGYALTTRLDAFLKVDNVAASLLTRTIQPLVGATADHNLVESLKFIQRLNDSTRSNGPGVKEMAKRLEIDDSIRQKYSQVIDAVFDRSFRKKYGRKLVTERARANKTAIDRLQQSPSVRAAQLALPVRHQVSRPSVPSAPQRPIRRSPDTKDVSVLIGGPRPPLKAGAVAGY